MPDPSEEIVPASDLAFGTNVQLGDAHASDPVPTRTASIGCASQVATVIVNPSSLRPRAIRGLSRPGSPQALASSPTDATTARTMARRRSRPEASGRPDTSPTSASVRVRPAARTSTFASLLAVDEAGPRGRRRRGRPRGRSGSRSTASSTGWHDRGGWRRSWARHRWRSGGSPRSGAGHAIAPRPLRACPAAW